MEPYGDSHQFRERRRVPIFPQSQAVGSEVIAPTGRAMEVILRSRKTSQSLSYMRLK
jgi:hypothetical protein